MRKRIALVAALAALAGVPRFDVADALTSKSYGRPVLVSDAKGLQHLPGPFPTSFPDTVPPPLLDDSFDPAEWDEISVAGDGAMLAYSSSVSEEGVPLQPKRIVVQRVGGKSKSVTVTGAQCDQPSIQFDDFGWRVAFRSTVGTVSNVQIHDFTRHGDEPIEETTPVTEIAGSGGAFDPALAARTRTRDVGSGISVKERDARIAFVSDGDLAGDNLSGAEQLFLWEEQADRFVQLTRNDQDGTRVNRPSISKSGETVFFESTADLAPQDADPLDASQIGNPDGVRQVFRWRRGRGVDQITFFRDDPATSAADGDCFSPRTDPSGRFVLFASRADPFEEGNTEHNLEIFAWVDVPSPAGRLRQITRTVVGDNVFPRPTTRLDAFAFYSSAPPPRTADGKGGAAPVAEFGQSGVEEYSPLPYVFQRGRVRFVHGMTAVENATRIDPLDLANPPRETAQRIPVFTGPPAPGATASKVFFAENQRPRPPKDVAKIDQDATFPAAFVLLSTGNGR